jgi:glycosyltransferase involved in cell wall biosynthesis
MYLQNFVELSNKNPRKVFPNFISMKHSKIVFWWRCACRSVMPLFRELAQIYEGEIYIIVQEAIGENRRQFGWQADDAGIAKLTILPAKGQWEFAKAVLIEQSQALHIVGGYQQMPLHQKVIAFAQSQDISYGVMAESPINMDAGWKALLKSLYINIVLPKITVPISTKSQFFICLSGRRIDASLKAGWPIEKIYPFGYFTQPRMVKSRKSIPGGDSLRLLCMGALVRYKGVDLLLHAAAIAKQMGVNFSLEIVGDGTEKQILKSLAKKLNIEKVVRFHGFITDIELEKIIISSDVLVCPGYTEPWGIRINDGINSGLAIISSDRLGASELVSASGSGFLFRSGDVGELANLIFSLAHDSELIQYFKEKSNAYAAMIAPRESAKYLLEILEHVYSPNEPKPTPPWYSARIVATSYSKI